MKDPEMLELGTRRSNPEKSTEHSKDFKTYANYLKTDIQNGIDVDFVCDVHELSRYFSETFDAILSSSTFEHLIKPWVAAEELCKCLKTGGLVFVQTHQTFPLHSYPGDYFRFSKEALASLFDFQDIEIIKCGYEFPAVIHSKRAPETKDAEAWLNVHILAKKL